MMNRIAGVVLLLVLGAMAQTIGASGAEDRPIEATEAIEAQAAVAKATFAGGCFWCMEAPFDALEGVLSTTSGYAGGDEPNPTYDAVSAGLTNHAEVVQVVYDPAKVSYDALLFVYWRNVDPLTANRQFCDRGRQYRTAIFTHDEAQLSAALASKARLEASGRFFQPIVTEIHEIGEFTPAEGIHQNYYLQNPARYRFYRLNCGRDTRLGTLWGKEAGGGSAAKH